MIASLALLVALSPVHAGQDAPICVPDKQKDAVTVLANLKLTPECDVSNPNLTLPKDKTIGSFRLNPPGATASSVTLSNGSKMELPAGLRVMSLGDDPANPGKIRILFHHKGQIQTGSVDSESRSTPGTKTSPRAFLEEAEFSLNLSSEYPAGESPEFPKYLSQVRTEFERQKKAGKFTDKHLEKLNRKMNEFFFTQTDNKVATIQKYTAELASNYNPKNTATGKKIFDETLFVPLSKAWFHSDPAMKKFFETVWDDGKRDARISGGASGEGITDDADLKDFAGLYAKALAELEKNGSEQAKKSPEGNWLRETVRKYEKTPKPFTRMIFLSPKTFEYNGSDRKFAEFVPVDQSLGGLPMSYEFSVLAHEMNVNSPSYLPSDTHLDEDRMLKVLGCVRDKGVDALSRDEITLRAAFGLNPHLSVLYLSTILKMSK